MKKDPILEIRSFGAFRAWGLVHPDFELYNAARGLMVLEQALYRVLFEAMWGAGFTASTVSGLRVDIKGLW